MASFTERFWLDESGATAIEYGLIAALIVVTIVSAVSALGSAISNLLFNRIAAAIP